MILLIITQLQISLITMAKDATCWANKRLLLCMQM